MNELYQETITRRGKTYHYDPDSDVYYAAQLPQGHWDSFGWIYVTVVLAGIAYCVEYWA